MADRLTYRWKKRPYRHQVAGVKKLLSTGWGGALLMEPRTGKTKVAIDYASILHVQGKVNRVLMVGPVVAIQVWKDQLKENCPVPYRLTVWDRKGRKVQQLPSYGKDILDIVLINYDAFSVPGDFRVHRSGPKKGQPITDRHGNKIRARRGGRYTMINQFKRWQPQLIILDESHRIKSPSAKKATALHTLAKVADYRVILTGTVVTKSKKLYDIYSQWQFLNPTRFAEMNFNEFKHYYGRWVKGGENYEVWKGPRNEDELHSRIHLDAFSITREECYDLPRQTDQIIDVPLEESAKVYDQMAEDMVARIHTGEITEASIKLVQRLRLQQITSGVSKTMPSPEHPSGRLAVIGAEKLRMIQSRLEDLMEADEKVVIGALFKPDIQRLFALCQKQLKVPVYGIYGGMKQRERDLAPKRFKEVRGGAVFIGQPAAAGEAIDLSCASILQWYSLPSSWVNFRQFSDRIALSDKPTFHEFFLAQGTIDYLLYETLQEDGDIGKKMIMSPERLLRVGGGKVTD